MLVACTASTASNPDSEKLNPQQGDLEELTPETGNGSNVELDGSELSQQPDLSQSEFSDGACSLNPGTCEPSGPSLTETEVQIPAPPPLPPPLPPAPAPPPIQAPAPSPSIQAPAPPLPVRELADKYASADAWQSYAFNDRQAWLSIGQTTESDAERQMRLAMADEVKMEAQHFADVLEHQQQSIHHDAWAYYEGDLMRLKHRRLVGMRLRFH